MNDTLQHLQKQRLTRLQMLYRAEYDVVAKHFATETLRRTLENLDDDGKDRLRSLWSASDDEIKKAHLELAFLPR